MLSDNIPMTLSLEPYRQRLLELQLDVESIKMYVLESANMTKSLGSEQQDAVQTRKRSELAVPQRRCFPG